MGIDDGKSRVRLRVGDLSLNTDDLEHIVGRAVDTLKAAGPSFELDPYLAVLLDRSLESHIVLMALARLKWNCALLDDDAPSEKVATQLEQLRVTRAYRARELLGESHGEAPKSLPYQVPNPNASSVGETTLVIFSSGSAGRPKGVVFTWRRIEEILSWSSQHNGVDSENQTILNLQPLHWSVGLFNVLSVDRGFSLASLDPLGLSPKRLISEMIAVQPAYVYLSAQFARILGKVAFSHRGPKISSIRRFAVGAGALRWEDLAGFQTLIPQDAEFVHTYGSSESVGMMAHRATFADIPSRGQIPLGQPRDPDGIRFASSHSAGLFEIQSSRNLAEGYLDKEQTSQRFVKDDDGICWWHSGDLVRHDLASGQYFFVGRVDDVVKVNDQLVSLVEIQDSILGLEGVDNALVLVLEVSGRDRTIAFVQPQVGMDLVANHVLNRLRDMLAGASVPYAAIVCDEIPLTSLLKPDTEALARLASDALAQDCHLSRQPRPEG